MSDYYESDYDDNIEYEGLSDEDDNAGAYGGYDDLYDDVVELAGYDAWDIEHHPEFNFDEESPLFKFDTFTEYFGLADEDGNVMMTYQALGNLSEMTAKLLKAWEKRSIVGHSESPDLSEVSDYPYPEIDAICSILLEPPDYLQVKAWLNI